MDYIYIDSLVISTVIDRAQTVSRRRPILVTAASLFAAYQLYKYVKKKYYAKSLQGKTFIITGAGGGIGRELSKRLAAAGAHLSLWDINQESLEATKVEIQTRQETESQDDSQVTRIHLQVVDMSSRAQIYRAAEETLKEFDNSIYGLINGVGIVNGQLFTETEDERIDKVIRVNTLSALWLTKAILPHMMNRGEDGKGEGHIVNISSAAGSFGLPRYAMHHSHCFANAH